MKLDEFKEEVLGHFIDTEGLVTVDRDPGKWSTGNGILFTSLFYSILFVNNAVTPEDFIRFSKAITRCWVGKNIGLLERNDGREDLQAHDDYHVASASYLLKTYHSEAIWNWGKDHCWSFNNQNPQKWSFKTWHARFLGHVPYLYAASYKKLSFMQTLALKFVLKLTSWESADDVMKTWLKVQVLKNIEGFEKSTQSWENILQQRYGSFGKVLEKYFGTNHPFSQVPNLGIWS